MGSASGLAATKTPSSDAALPSAPTTIVTESSAESARDRVPSSSSPSTAKAAGNEAEEASRSDQKDVIETEEAKISDRTLVRASAATHQADEIAPTDHANGLQDQTNYLPPRQVVVVFGALTVCIFLSFMDQTIVSSALPNISAAFDAGRSSSWVASIYLLVQTAVLPVWGRLSDIFGRKYCMLACISIFMIGSLASALAQTMTQLIVFRGLQGFGGGGLLTLVFIIISDIVTLKERGFYQGINEITITISNGIGPVVGGVLSQKVSWRWCFWINLPLSALAIVVVTFFLPLKRVRGDIGKKLLQIDYPGAIMTLFAAAMIMFPLLWGGTSWPWKSAQVLGTLLGGVALWVVFFVWEYKFARIPIISMRIFGGSGGSTVNAILLATLLQGATNLTQVYYVPQYLQIARGVSAIRSGVLILPLLLPITFMVFISGQLLARTGEYKPSICFGYGMWCVGVGLMSTVNRDTSTARLCGYLIITGFGQGQSLQTSMVALQASVPRSEMSVITSMRNFLRSLGGSLALAVAATVINNTLRSQLTGQGFDSSLIDAFIDDSTGIWRPSKISGSGLYNLTTTQKEEMAEAYVKGFQTVFHCLIGLIGFNCIISCIFIKRISLNKADEAALKARGKAWIEQRGAKGKGPDLEKGAKEEEEAEGSPIGESAVSTVVDPQDGIKLEGQGMVRSAVEPLLEKDTDVK